MGEPGKAPKLCFYFARESVSGPLGGPYRPALDGTTRPARAILIYAGGLMIGVGDSLKKLNDPEERAHGNSVDDVDNAGHTR